MSGNTVCTQIYRCGPYTFSSWITRIGTNQDKEWWQATAHGREIDGRFGTLQAAMMAALGVTQEPPDHPRSLPVTRD